MVSVFNSKKNDTLSHNSNVAKPTMIMYSKKMNQFALKTLRKKAGFSADNVNHNDKQIATRTR